MRLGLWATSQTRAWLKDSASESKLAKQHTAGAHDRCRPAAKERMDRVVNA